MGEGGQGDSRADVELVRRGLARSRTEAAALVRAGRVTSAGRTLTKPSAPVPGDVDLVVADDGPRFVSRAAYKLVGFLDAVAGAGDPLPVAGRRCLDAGASTGGFTQVLLDRGAAHVEAVDVGHDQLAGPVAGDPRVTDRSGTTVRGLTPADVGGPVDLLVADLSFISLRKVLPDLLGLLAADGDLVVMVKPQFEVGKARLGSGGVVRDPALRRSAVLDVASDGVGLGLAVRAVRASDLPGPSGNVEYFVRFAREPVGPSSVPPGRLEDVVTAAVQDGPA